MHVAYLLTLEIAVMMLDTAKQLGACLLGHVRLIERIQ